MNIDWLKRTAGKFKNPQAQGSAGSNTNISTTSDGFNTSDPQIEISDASITNGVDLTPRNKHSTLGKAFKKSSHSAFTISGKRSTSQHEDVRNAFSIATQDVTNTAASNSPNLNNNTISIDESSKSDSLFSPLLFFKKGDSSRDVDESQSVANEIASLFEQYSLERATYEKKAKDFQQLQEKSQKELEGQISLSSSLMSVDDAFHIDNNSFEEDTFIQTIRNKHSTYSLNKSTDIRITSAASTATLSGKPSGNPIIPVDETAASKRKMVTDTVENELQAVEKLERESLMTLKKFLVKFVKESDPLPDYAFLVEKFLTQENLQSATVHAMKNSGNSIPYISAFPLKDKYSSYQKGTGNLNQSPTTSNFSAIPGIAEDAPANSLTRSLSTKSAKTVASDDAVAAIVPMEADEFDDINGSKKGISSTIKGLSTRTKSKNPKDSKFFGRGTLKGKGKLHLYTDADELFSGISSETNTISRSTISNKFQPSEVPVSKIVVSEVLNTFRLLITKGEGDSYTQALRTKASIMNSLNDLGEARDNASTTSSVSSTETFLSISHYSNLELDVILYSLQFFEILSRKAINKEVLFSSNLLGSIERTMMWLMTGMDNVEGEDINSKFGICVACCLLIQRIIDPTCAWYNCIREGRSQTTLSACQITQLDDIYKPKLQLFLELTVKLLESIRVSNRKINTEPQVVYATIQLFNIIGSCILIDPALVSDVLGARSSTLVEFFAKPELLQKKKNIDHSLYYGDDELENFFKEDSTTSRNETNTLHLVLPLLYMSLTHLCHAFTMDVNLSQLLPSRTWLKSMVSQLSYYLSPSCIYSDLPQRYFDFCYHYIEEATSEITNQPIEDIPQSLPLLVHLYQFKTFLTPQSSRPSNHQESYSTDFQQEPEPAPDNINVTSMLTHSISSGQVVDLAAAAVTISTSRRMSRHDFRKADAQLIICMREFAVLIETIYNKDLIKDADGIIRYAFSVLLHSVLVDGTEDAMFAAAAAALAAANLTQDSPTSPIAAAAAQRLDFPTEEIVQVSEDISTKVANPVSNYITRNSHELSCYSSPSEHVSRPFYEVRKTSILTEMDVLGLWNKVILEDPNLWNSRAQFRLEIMDLIAHCGASVSAGTSPIKILVQLLEYPTFRKDICNTLSKMVRSSVFEMQARILIFKGHRELFRLLGRIDLVTIEPFLLEFIESVVSDNKIVLFDLYADKTCLDTLFYLTESGTTVDFAVRIIFSVIKNLAINYPTVEYSGNGSDIKNFTTTKILVRLFESLKIPAVDSSSYDLQVVILNGIISLLHVPDPSNKQKVKERRLFQQRLYECKVLTTLLCVLNTVPTNSDNIKKKEWYKELVQLALSAISACLRGNDTKLFSMINGYNEIYKRVVVKKKYDCWPEFLDAFMLLFYDFESEQVTGNVDTVKALLKMYFKIGDYRKQLLSYLIEVASTSEEGLIIMHSAGVISYCVTQIMPRLVFKEEIEQVLSLTRIIASYSVTVAEVKTLLSSLNSAGTATSKQSISTQTEEDDDEEDVKRKAAARTKTRMHSITGRRISHFDFEIGLTDVNRSDLEVPLYYDILCKEIQEIVDNQSTDMEMFTFSGKDSGIALPTLDKWPLTNGYTVMLWFRIMDAPRDTSTSRKLVSPRLLSLLSADGANQIELYLESGRINVNITKNKKAFISTVNDHSVISGKWHHLVFSHANPKFPWMSNSDASIHINGIQCWKDKLEFPEMCTYSNNRLGSQAIINNDESSSTSCTHCFSGQVTSFYLMNEAFQGGLFTGIFKKGPSRTIRFRPEEYQYHKELDSALFEGNIANSISIYFNPMAVNTELSQAVNLAETVFKDAQTDASNAPATTVATQAQTQGQAEGVFSEANNGRLLFGTSIKRTKSFGSAVHALGGMGILVPILGQADMHGGDLVGSLIESEQQLVRQMRIIRFFKLVGTLMSSDEIHKQMFFNMECPKILGYILQFTNPGNLCKQVFNEVFILMDVCRTEPKFVLEIEKHLIFNLDLWSNAFYSVQVEYFQHLHSFIKETIDHISEHFGVYMWLNVLTTHYSYTGRHAAVPARRRVETNKSLRKYIGHILVELLCCPTTSENDIQHLIDVCICSDDYEHVAELCGFIIESNIRCSVKLMDRFLNNGLSEMLSLLLSHESVNVRVASMQVLFFFLKSDLNDKWKKKLRLEQVQWIPNFDTISSQLGNSSLFTLLLCNHKSSLDTYFALLQLGLQEILIDWESGNVVSHVKDSKQANFTYPAFVQSIFELLALTDAEYMEKVNILNELNSAFHKFKDNEKTVYAKSWVFTLLATLPQGIKWRLDKNFTLAGTSIYLNEPNSNSNSLYFAGKSMNNMAFNVEALTDKQSKRLSALSTTSTLRHVSTFDIADVELSNPDEEMPVEVPQEISKKITKSKSLFKLGQSKAKPDVKDLNNDSLSRKSTHHEQAITSDNEKYPFDSLDESELSNTVIEVLTTLMLDVYSKDNSSWRLWEDVFIYLLCLGSKQAFEGLVSSIFVKFLDSINRIVSQSDPKSLGKTIITNILHTVYLVDEILFFFDRGIKTSISSEFISLYDSTQKTDKRLVSVLTNLANVSSSNINIAGPSDNPFSIFPNLSRQTTDLIMTLLDKGIFDFGSYSESDKVGHSRNGGLVRIVSRLLLNGLDLQDKFIWEYAVKNLGHIIERHEKILTDKSTRLWILGRLSIAYRSCSNDNALLSNSLIPVFVLICSKWKDLFNKFFTESKKERLIPADLLSSALNDNEVFKHMVSSPEWGTLLTKYFEAGITSVEGDSPSTISQCAKRYIRTTRSTMQNHLKFESNFKRILQTMDSLLSKMRSSKVEEEAKVQEGFLFNRTSDRRSLERQVAMLYRQLTMERGIWCTEGTLELSENTDDSHKWKMDRAENNVRMRRRLVVNWEFDDHSVASAKRDRSDGDTITPIPPLISNNSSHSKSSKNLLAKGANASKEATTEASNMLIGRVERRKTLKKKDSNSEFKYTPTGTTLEDEEDDWNVLNTDDFLMQQKQQQQDTLTEGERLVYSCPCEMILFTNAVKGRLELTTKNLCFITDFKATTENLSEVEREATVMLLVDVDALLKERKWPLEDVVECYLRRYLLRRSAVELFFADRTNYLLNFPGTEKTAHKERMKFLGKLLSVHPPNLNVADARLSPGELLKKTGLTAKWKRREISNFEYLMGLNTISGRTYNDLTQYPVFPWVLSDYESQSIDLNDPNIYRDLSKPMGALNENRLEQYIERYENFEDPTGRTKKFFYGTHYSSAATVCYYLLRMEPYTSLHICLQNGKFDHSDRQFSTLQACWNSCLNANGDVKELIPEFYYMPEFLVNSNKFDLGRRQEGDLLDNVGLPPWAKTSEEFISMHRAALESDYVSDHLHEWIDLIWGYKQTGEEAVKAYNVFYYLTYEGAINIDDIKDPVERKSIEDQINNFGQTPSQLFKRPHPKRDSKDKLQTPLFQVPMHYERFNCDLKGGQLLFNAIVNPNYAYNKTAIKSTYVADSQSDVKGVDRYKIITIDSNLIVGTHKWQSTTSSATGVIKGAKLEADKLPITKRTLDFKLTSAKQLSSKLFAVSNDGRYLFGAGSWDSSFQIWNLSSGQPKPVDLVFGHRDIVTCVAIGEDDQTVITGSQDTTVMAWELETNKDGEKVISRNSVKVFCGHDSDVTCVAVNVEHGIVVSGSRDGTVMVHILNDSSYLRSLIPTSKDGERLLVNNVIITPEAEIVILSSDSKNPNVSYLHAYSVNGHLLADRCWSVKINQIASCSKGESVVAVDEKGKVTLLTKFLETIHRYDFNQPLLSVSISVDRRTLILGREDGQLLFVTIDGSKTE